jgi:hypothetical protein
VSVPDTSRTAAVYDENGLLRIDGFLDATGGIVAAPTYSDDHSFQTTATDLNVDPAVGDDTNTHFYAGGMFSIIGDTLTKTKNYLAGVIGSYNLTGTKATTYPTAGLMGLIGDTVTHVDGAVMAVLDGDSGQTNGSAMYGVMSNNSTAASGTNFGLDLQSAAHDGYIPVDAAFYKVAPLRLVSDVVFIIGAAAPTNGTTGANNAGPGSLYFATTTPKLYINTNTKASPTWTVVGSQS